MLLNSTFKYLSNSEVFVEKAEKYLTEYENPCFFEQVDQQQHNPNHKIPANRVERSENPNNTSRRQKP